MIDLTFFAVQFGGLDNFAFIVDPVKLASVFLDGGELRTPELEHAVDEIAQGYAGFYFGRFDVRAESAAALSRGEFRILELNGVTSEAAHIYDARHSVFTGWRTIASQWGMAYEIGAVNAARGARVSRVRELAGAFLADRLRMNRQKSQQKSRKKRSRRAP